jgi:C4-dicarboxylate-specific signal transduction histidine kinase
MATRRLDRLLTPLDMRITRYGLALSLVALALSLTLVLQHYESGRPTLFLFFAAIVAAAWFGGGGPGCLAAAASVPAGLYFYSASLPGLSVTLDNVVLFFFFVVCAMVGGLLSSRQREAEISLQRTHRQLEIKAAELSATNEALTAEMAERRRAELALADTRATLAHAARLTAMGELTASIAHEVNQPLAAVGTNASCCVRWLEPDNFRPEDAREAAASVVQDVNRASEVIKRIRAMVRRAPTERTALDLNHLVSDAMPLLDNELRRHGIDVVTDFENPLPGILGDRVQLQQVILNIVLNAAEAMSGVARARVLTLRTRMHGAETVALTVTDTGIGFGGRAPDEMFDAFVTSKPDGMGLGLSICRSIVETHGGHMSASQGEPNGAIVDVVLPVEASHEH